MLELMQNSPLFAVFTIVALGFLLGKITVKGLSLGVSAVIFVALAFGHYGVSVPPILGTFGLVLFIFTIGIQAGPGFVDSFRSKGKTLILLTLLIIFSGALTGVILKYVCNEPMPRIIGLLAGALTSTPGLAVAIDTTKSPDASIAYGIAYPFGVIGVILFVKLLPKMLHKDLDAEARKLEKARRSKFPSLTVSLFDVETETALGRSLADLNIRAVTGAVISRVSRKGRIFTPKADTVLEKGDVLQAVGSKSALEKLSVMVGPFEPGELPLTSAQTTESVLLTKQEMINKQIGELKLRENFGCTITRIRRSGIDLAPSPDFALKFGDKIMIVGEKEGIQGVAKLLGNNKRLLSDTDLFPIALGIIFGILVGEFHLTFGQSFSFSPGLSGGILIVALALSAIGKTGPIIWTMSGSANHLLRELGLLLFLTEVGTSAGKTLVQTFEQSGFVLFGIGAALTLVPLIIATLAARFIFKVTLPDLLGTLTGGMTSTPGLAAVDSMTDSNIPGVAYATVYPIAMVLLIIAIQIMSVIA